ncbi:MAG: hypothetical protein ACU0BS_09620 [Hasllibacter sp.]
MRRPGIAPDLTNPFLVSAFGVAFVALTWIWSALGLVPALLVAWLADRTIANWPRAEAVRIRAEDRRADWETRDR